MIRFFAHAQGQQGLTKGVVDLVGAGVVEVFPLQPNAGPPFGPAVVLVEPFGLIERRGPADVVLKQVVEALGEGRVLPGLGGGGLELRQGGDQGFGHVLAAELAKAAQGIGADGRFQRCGINGEGRDGAGHRRRCKRVPA